MKALWRISNYIDLGGWGGKKFSSRWTSLGRRVIYFAESPTAALVETLVHLEVESEDTPDFYTLLKIVVPDDLAIHPLDPPAGSEWKQDLKLTRRMGDAWLVSLETPLARVPSAIAPCTWNYLLNPEHPDAKQVQIAEVIKERFDNRLFRFGTR
ncbi:MAG TPA: RES family NAD+ phosphorylase [Terracidiphilus sp.]|nr:RES family NAD+ phosphorylase [Terracidiphilus sp.]